jgi:hypothetical protein
MTDPADVRRGCSPPVCHRPTWEDVIDDVCEDPDRWLVIGPDQVSHPSTTISREAADEAEAGYEVDEIIARRGKARPPQARSAPSTVESVRLDPELKERLARRAEDEGVPVSERIREALRQHLAAGSSVP